MRRESRAREGGNDIDRTTAEARASGTVGGRIRGPAGVGCGAQPADSGKFVDDRHRTEGMEDSSTGARPMQSAATGEPADWPAFGRFRRVSVAVGSLSAAVHEGTGERPAAVSWRCDTGGK